MSTPATDETPGDTEADDFAWQVTKKPGDSTAHIELGSMYADFDGAALDLLMHRIGRGMIQIGTIALESRVSDDDEDGDDW